MYTMYVFAQKNSPDSLSDINQNLSYIDEDEDEVYFKREIINIWMFVWEGLLYLPIRYSGQFRSISPLLSNMGEKALIALLQKDDQA